MLGDKAELFEVSCSNAKLHSPGNAQVEKNPTIVNFPVKNLLLEGAVALPPGTAMAMDSLCMPHPQVCICGRP